MTTSDSFRDRQQNPSAPGHALAIVLMKHQEPIWTLDACLGAVSYLFFGPNDGIFSYFPSKIGATKPGGCLFHPFSELNIGHMQLV